MAHRVALTGAMGAGKTTVAKAFEALGVACFYSDSEAKRCYEDADFCRRLADALPVPVLDSEGRVSMPLLKQCVFGDARMRQTVTDMVHPYVIDRFEDFCRRHSGDRYVLFESAVLYEYGLQRLVDRVVCVHLDKEERVRRIMLRDASTREEVEARLACQMSADEKLMAADFVVLNYEGNPRQRQVATLHQWLSVL